MCIQPLPNTHVIHSLLALCFLSMVGCANVARVSVSSLSGQEPNGDSKNIALSEDGRYTAFESEASNMVAGDGNFGPDIFVRDNFTGTLELISKSTSGGVGNGWSRAPDISPNGRFVVFASSASNLVVGDTNGGTSDVFLYDRQTGVMEIVSLDAAGLQGTGASRGGSITSDGNMIAFFTASPFSASDVNTLDDVYVRDRSLGDTTLISKALSGGLALGDSFNPRITNDGNNIAFESFSNGFTNNDTGPFKKIYAMSLTFFVRVNATEDANSGAAIGDIDGGLFEAKILFSSTADNLTVGDNNGFSDIFLTTAGLSGPGLIVQTVRITDGNGDSVQPVLGREDGNGDFSIAYETTASDLQESGASPADTNSLRDVYLWESGPGSSRHRLMSQTWLAGLASNISVGPALSPNGKAIAFESYATNLGPTDTNTKKDVYIRPTLVPKIDSVSGTLQVGQTSVLTFSGEFPDVAWSALLSGEGIVSATTGANTGSSIEVTVTLDASAIPGARNIWIFKGAPELGMPAELGAGDFIGVTVVP